MSKKTPLTDVFASQKLQCLKESRIASVTNFVANGDTHCTEGTGGHCTGGTGGHDSTTDRTDHRLDHHHQPTTNPPPSPSPIIIMARLGGSRNDPPNRNMRIHQAETMNRTLSRICQERSPHQTFVGSSSQQAFFCTSPAHGRDFGNC